MGTDNLFHKRRIRREQDLKRRQEIRSAYDVVLIVCEGEKSEPSYFKALRKALRLNQANIVILKRPQGNDPLSLVNHAEEEFKRERKLDPEKQGYDRVFVIFDRDVHMTYEEALRKITTLNKKVKGRFDGITSVPCFEFWLLLHFEDTARPYASTGSQSACDCVVRDLRKHLPHYDKGNPKVFSDTYPLVGVAIRRAELLEKRQTQAETDNPSTKVHRLISYLSGLKG